MAEAPNNSTAQTVPIATQAATTGYYNATPGGSLTLADLQAVFNAMPAPPATLPAGYAMNQATWDKLKSRAMVNLGRDIVPLWSAEMCGLEIKIDARLHDGVVIPFDPPGKVVLPPMRSLEEIKQESMRADISRYKKLIRAGELIDGPRQSGKSTAILEVIHEDHAGMARLGTPTPALRDIMRARYRAAYPDDVVPDVFAVSTLAVAGVAHDKPVYVDTYAAVSDKIRFEFERWLDKAPAGAW